MTLQIRQFQEDDDDDDVQTQLLFSTTSTYPSNHLNSRYQIQKNPNTIVTSSSSSSSLLVSSSSIVSRVGSSRISEKEEKIVQRGIW